MGRRIGRKEEEAMDLWYALAIRDATHQNEETNELLDDADALVVPTDDEDEEGQ
jgi:hypothetical protein